MYWVTAVLNLKLGHSVNFGFRTIIYLSKLLLKNGGCINKISHLIFHAASAIIETTHTYDFTQLLQKN